MPVRMRLQRIGKKGNPFYRLVVANSTRKRDGKYLEAIGTYDPIPDKSGAKHIELATDRVKYWLTVGAQPTETMAKLIAKCGLAPPKPVFLTLGQHQQRRIRAEQSIEEKLAHLTRRAAKVPDSPLALRLAAKLEMIENGTYGYTDPLLKVSSGSSPVAEAASREEENKLGREMETLIQESDPRTAEAAAAGAAETLRPKTKRDVGLERQQKLFEKVSNWMKLK